MKDKRATGETGEDIAAKYLIEQGYKVIGRNIRTPYGEIDLVVSGRQQVRFVEVKTRSNRSFGFPETAITEKKLEHMLTSAEYYLQQYPELTSSWQLDVISIELDGDGKYTLKWFENAS